jgi:hypothetical protein
MELYNVGGLPIVVIDDFYTKEECDLIWQELSFLNSTEGNFGGPEKTGTATHESVILKKNSGIFLDEVYNLRTFSNILNLNRKVFSLSSSLTEKSFFFKYLDQSNQDSTLVQYYENSDYYKSHWDKSLITAISWFYQKPKSFSGGDIIFNDELKVECKYNRLVIFASVINHEVEEVKLGQNLLKQNLGRYSISQFISIKL